MLGERAGRQGGFGLLRFVWGVALLALLAVALLFGGGWLWTQQPMSLSQETAEVSVEPGMTPRATAQAWVDAGVQTDPWLLYQWFRWSGQARQIKAGSYEIGHGVSPQRLLRIMVQGDESLSTVKLIEGWTFRKWRQVLSEAEGLRIETAAMSDAELMAALGSPDVAPEGQFFPDTYAYAKGSTDLAVMRRAHRAMKRQLEDAWAQRQPGLKLQTPQEALILASIIEKETGHEDDRGLVSSVFNNRLKIGMPLQTDPTVIYGLGDAFDGNLRKIDLQMDTPFNTYTRGGLPPTPIAMPGRASLMAAVQPEPSRALYFVASGGGRSAFSETLAEHNRAVNRYQRNRP
ncbi:endolytic transglycosylase MltG [Aquabacterium lacunae]|uniref:Endolytic murein transglycosylase n=1 Tax=Aquabacterium lacunae TaxID=2528630 RepID=A0A4Q9GWS7_9BURK|nr:endolytic transglycosylase MltG [Aquabacterium lacunae]